MAHIFWNFLVATGVYAGSDISTIFAFTQPISGSKPIYLGPRYHHRGRRFCADIFDISIQDVRRPE